MAKDYVRRKPGKRRNNAPRQLFLILASFLSGYLVASVFDWASFTSWVDKQVAAHRQTPPAPPKKVVKKEAPKPKFEFYTLLEKDSQAPIEQPKAMEMTVAKAPPPPSQQTAKPIADALVANLDSKSSKPIARQQAESYNLQVASFSKKSDAEQLKASLVLQGFDVSISPTLHGTVTWYRIIAGPFSTRIAAEKAQFAVARTQRMKGMILKMQG